MATTQQTKVSVHHAQDIEGGPNAAALAQAVERKFGDNSRVKFVSKEGLIFEAEISSLEAIDRDNIQWIVRGSALDPRDTTIPRNWRRYFASYRSDTRIGCFVFID